MSNRLVIVNFLEKVPTEEFGSSQRPLHMTLLPPFIYGGQLETFSDELRDISHNTNPFFIRTNGDALFGSNQDIPVSLIEPDRYSSEIHSKLASLVTRLDLKYEHSSLSENEYRFHVTAQKGQKAPEDIDIQIDRFSLVDRQANGKMGRKKVIKSFKFVLE